MRKTKKVQLMVSVENTPTARHTLSDFEGTVENNVAITLVIKSVIDVPMVLEKLRKGKLAFDFYINGQVMDVSLIY